MTRQLTDQQWAALLLSVAGVPIIDAVLQCKARDLLDLADLMDKAHAASINQPWHLSDGDKASLLKFAQLFSIDAETAQPIPHDDEPTSAAQGEVISIDDFLDQMTGEGE